MNSRRRGGFTLVEVLIVVVIMAVLAATIIPQFTSSTKDAKLSAAKFNLHTLRSQLELYKAEHTGSLPGAALTELISKTDAAGTVSTTGAYGPYVEQLPQNPLTETSTVKAVTSDPITSSDITTTGEGWLYNVTTGEIRGNHADLIDF